jgi:hypothetical protein
LNRNALKEKAIAHCCAQSLFFHLRGVCAPLNAQARFPLRRQTEKGKPAKESDQPPRGLCLSRARGLWNMMRLACYLMPIKGPARLGNFAVLRT